MLSAIPDNGGEPYKDRAIFDKEFKKAEKAADLKLPAAVKKSIFKALSEQDDTAEVCVDKKGNPEADSSLRDTETVPLNENINEYFEREVKPHVPDAWINESVVDEKDGQIGKVGYEINFNRYFYEYVPPRPLEEIEADIRVVEKEIVQMLQEIAV